jgi:cyclophilin family peptidyl-prolyl cis-trans isomerase/HEAT repeat protein
LALILTLTTPLVAESPGGLGPRRAYLLKSLDAWALDLSVAIPMVQDPQRIARAQAVTVIASNPSRKSLRLLGMYAGDSDPRVRQRVMLAAGRLGRDGLKLALRGLSDRSPLVRQAAAWAACHSGPDALAPLTKLLRQERDRPVLESLLANLWRLEGAEWVPLVAPYAKSTDVHLRRAAAYSLSRTGSSTARAAQREFAADDEPVIRATALLGLARGELEEEDLAVVEAAIADSDWRVRTAIYRVLAARDSMALGGASTKQILADCSADRSQLAVSAISAAGALEDCGDAAVFQKLADGNRPWLAATALEALATRDVDQAGDMAAQWLGSDDLWRRRAAARIAVDLQPSFEKRVASADEASVRLAWLEALAMDEVMLRAEALRALLKTDPDPAVRAQLMSLLRSAGEAPGQEELLALHTNWKTDLMPDARIEALTAAMEATADGEERRQLLAIGLADAEPTAVAMAVNAARGLGMQVDLAAREPRHGAKWYTELVEWTATPRWLDVVTNRGAFRIRLDLASAPLTAREISNLAADGFYDGLSWHRVVPNFVVQGGDPRGDGWGGPGFALPDEPSMRPFDSWRVGIATSGPQTGGCQLFVTLLPADHLTGHYTNFGEVVEGRDALAALEVGDTILSIRPVSGGAPGPLDASSS